MNSNIQQTLSLKLHLSNQILVYFLFKKLGHKKNQLFKNIHETPANIETQMEHEGFALKTLFFVFASPEQ